MMNDFDNNDLERNEIEENARFVLEKLKLTIIELLEVYLKY